jgi:hypothetical protein
MPEILFATKIVSGLEGIKLDLRSLHMVTVDQLYTTVTSHPIIGTFRKRLHKNHVFTALPLPYLCNHP